MSATFNNKNYTCEQSFVETAVTMWKTAFPNKPETDPTLIAQIEGTLAQFLSATQTFAKLELQDKAERLTAEFNARDSVVSDIASMTGMFKEYATSLKAITDELGAEPAITMDGTVKVKIPTTAQTPVTAIFTTFGTPTALRTITDGEGENAKSYLMVEGNIDALKEQKAKYVTAYGKLTLTVGELLAGEKGNFAWKYDPAQGKVVVSILDGQGKKVASGGTDKPASTPTQHGNRPSSIPAGHKSGTVKWNGQTFSGTFGEMFDALKNAGYPFSEAQIKSRVVSQVITRFANIEVVETH